MIDTIKPMGLDLTKDLHGHVRVELRDRWTGRVVDSQEKDNLVTNAVQKLLLSGGWVQAQNSTINALWTPIRSKALGGLMLFDGTLTESADNTHFPSSAKLVAFAGQNSNSESSKGGSYNAEESVWTSNGFTSVWDFLTSQANGTIASLARTSAFIVNGFQTHQIVLGPFQNMLTPPVVLGADVANGFIYLTYPTNQIISGRTISSNTIYRAKWVPDKIRLLETVSDVLAWEEVKTLSSSDGNATAYWFQYDQYANNFIYRNRTTLHIIAMDGTHSTKTLTGAPSTTDVFATENYYFVPNIPTVYRYDKTNPASAQTITVPGTVTYFTPGYNDMLYANSSSASDGVTIVYPDLTIINTGTLSAIKGSASNHQVGAYYYNLPQGSNAWPPDNYLGTIANLDSPVTKSSSQTMKITYTLTEA